MTYVYKGFSTKNFQKTKDFVLTDIDIVKEDLINHLLTRRGERVKMARFGTRIPDLVMEPLTEDTINKIKEDVAYVMNYDPRVELVDMAVIPIYDESSVLVLVDLNYIELNVKDRLSLRLEFNT